MFHLRLKIFIFLCISGLIVTIGRLYTLQTSNLKEARQEIADMRILPAKQRPTIRGKILDRYERPVALDEPAFYLQINYQLTRYMDRRWQEGQICRRIIKHENADEHKSRQEVEEELAGEWQEPFNRLEEAINLANVLTDVSKDEILSEIELINNRIWEMSRWLWWKRRHPNDSRATYIEDRGELDPKDIVAMDLEEMYSSYPLVELKNQRDLLQAQKELIHLEGLEIKPEAKRSYPFGCAACQLIGWVGPVNQSDMDRFDDDNYMRYQIGDLHGKFGLERVYESVLRGRRGEVQYDRQGNLLEKKEPEYGQDIQLTLDMELQRKIEEQLAAPGQPHGKKLCAAVVLEAARNDILAIASIPTFDLNTIRKNYDDVFVKDPNDPEVHRALEKNYPPGSTVKPIICIAGLEEKKISPWSTISCPSTPPPKGWPRCILQRDHHIGHDDQFANEGGNIARNAIRGSCNVFFTRLADRLDGKDLQKWLFNFGYGQDVLPTPLLEDNVSQKYHIPQAHGNLIYGVQGDPVTTPLDLPEMPNHEKKWWGMGQGNLRATVLQVANALSAIARNGVYKAPRLVFDEQDPFNDKYRKQLPISSETLSVVRDGMHAVIYEPHGTANSRFKDSDLLNRGMTLYGKTGSTQGPEHAWFECFAEDTVGRTIVIAVLVEGGERGAGEAAPLGEKILRLVNEAGYIGEKPKAP